jgi:FkbM family methyltransferase
MVCFDVGANIGEMTLHMARRTSPSGRVYAFEPVPGVFARLSENIARNGMAQTINASRIALSRENGTARMTFADETFENQGRGSIANVDQKELSGFGEVQTMRIDDFVERDGVDRIDLMKIDIQGAEPLLLEGGPKVFGAMGPDLLIEISPEDLAGLGRSSQDLVGLLRGFGYELFAMHNGDVADRLPQSVPPDFRADNIYCTKSRT